MHGPSSFEPAYRHLHFSPRSPAHTSSLQLLRTLVLLAFLVFFAVTVGTTAAGTSHMSHVGGFLGGLCCGLLLLPNLHRSRSETVVVAVAAAGAVALYLAPPLVFYLRQLPRVCCNC